MFKSPRDVPLAKTEGRIDKVAEFMVQQLDDERVTYKHSYVYRVLQPGDIIFGRALTGCTLEGAKGEDCARMTIVRTTPLTLDQFGQQHCPVLAHATATALLP
jgi:hypothetical protein